MYEGTVARGAPRDDVPAFAAGINVTLNTRGEIVMGRTTYQRMGAPKAFIVLFDTVNNRIGLKPSVPTMRNAYPAGPRGRCGARVVRAYRLFREYGIDVPQTLKFHDAEIDQDGILVLDLRTAKVSLRAANHPFTGKRRNPDKPPRGSAAESPESG